MPRTIAGRRKQPHQQIDRTIINRIKGDRCLQPHQHSEHMVHIAMPRMRNGDARADSGRAQRLTLHQGIHERGGIRVTQHMGSGIRHRLQGLTFGRDASAQDDTVPGDQISDFHIHPRNYATVGPEGISPLGPTCGPLKALYRRTVYRTVSVL